MVKQKLEKTNTPTYKWWQKEALENERLLQQIIDLKEKELELKQIIIDLKEQIYENSTQDR